MPGIDDPVLFWAPSINPGNLALLAGDKLPGWRGDHADRRDVAIAACASSFDAAGKPTGQERMLTDLGQRLRDVRQGPDGLVYVLTDETAGALLDRALIAGCSGRASPARSLRR